MSTVLIDLIRIQIAVFAVMVVSIAVSEVRAMLLDREPATDATPRRRRLVSNAVGRLFRRKTEPSFTSAGALITNAPL